MLTWLGAAILSSTELQNIRSLEKFIPVKMKTSRKGS